MRVYVKNEHEGVCTVDLCVSQSPVPLAVKGSQALRFSLYHVVLRPGMVGLPF